MHRVIVTTFCSVLIVTCSADGFAAEARSARATGKTAGQASWPQWRGPNRDGISPDTGLIQSWEQQAPRLLWKGSGLGAGFASVSISDGRIFTMGDRGDRQFVIALSLADGKELWSTPIGSAWDKGGYAGPRCTPTTDGDLLYAVGTRGDLVCLEAASGSVRWQKNFARDFGAERSPHWGFSESPLVDGDKLICTPGGEDAMLVALDKRDGSEIWRSVIPELGGVGKAEAGYSSAVISEGVGVRQYVQLVGKGVIGVRADDGKYLWGYSRIANNVANIPTPIVSGNYVFSSTGYGSGGTALLELTPSGDGVRAREVYYLKNTQFQVHLGGMVKIGDYVYAGHGHNDGKPTCLEFKTGRIVWGEKRGPGSDSAGVAYADGNMYFRYQDGKMALIEATPDAEAFRLKGTFDIPDSEKPSWPHPVIAGGKLYLREQDSLLCYDLKR